MASTSRSLPKLDLNDLEARLRTLLLDVAKYIDPERPSQLRFTGGWVRDKLLGIESHDIDVAIDNMTGFDFGLKMKDYLENPEVIKKYASDISTSERGSSGEAGTEKEIYHGIHKIEANPEKSKHLETVTTRIFGLDIDLVNLRKETYTDDSRNPQMEFGTPEEDAFRRDATINALFYNLQTSQVEDLTQMGLDDMKQKVIRTPLEPYQTFKDDPLRVLRLVRFSSRLGYDLEHPAQVAAAEDSIKEALKLKISRERVGVELEKMLRGPNPLKALSLIDKLGLYRTIFCDPTTETTFQPNVAAWSVCYELVADLLAQPDSVIYEVALSDSDKCYQAWLLTPFVPLFDAPIKQNGKKAQKDPLLYATSVAREGIKCNNKICDIVTHSVRNAENIIAVKDRYLLGRKSKDKPFEEDPCGRDTLGMALRSWGPTWKSQLIYALCVEATRRSSGSKTIMNEYELFLQWLKKLGLISVCDLKTLLNGNDLAQAMGVKPGPWMKDALNIVMAWQLRNPDLSDPQGAIDAVKNKQGELSAVLTRYFLQLTIRPLFANSKNHNVTAQGRKMMQTEKLPKRYEDIEAERVDKLWKADKNLYALDILTWSVDCLDEQLVEKNWPLLIPPILGLLDDADYQYKVKGCRLLQKLLQSTSAKMLDRTGLGQVFADAISPSLAYLPTLTPEEESIALIEAEYPALVHLTTVRYPIANIYKIDMASPRTRSLALILHDHILPSIQHVSETHPAVATSLLKQLSLVVQSLAGNATAQLVHLIPCVTNLLNSPFGSTYPPMLKGAAVSIQVILANTWPRAWYWRVEVMKGLGGCWIRILQELSDLRSEDEQRRSRPIRPNIDRVRLLEETEERTKSLEEVRAELNRAARMLVRAVETTSVKKEGAVQIEDEEYGYGVDIHDEIKQLIAANGALQGLFT